MFTGRRTTVCTGRRWSPSPMHSTRTSSMRHLPKDERERRVREAAAVAGADGAVGEAAAFLTEIKVAYDEPLTGDQHHGRPARSVPAPVLRALPRANVASERRPALAVDVEQLHCRPAERRGPDRQGRSRRCRLEESGCVTPGTIYSLVKAGGIVGIFTNPTDATPITNGEVITPDSAGCPSQQSPEPVTINYTADEVTATVAGEKKTSSGRRSARRMSWAGSVVGLSMRLTSRQGNRPRICLAWAILLMPSASAASRM